MSFHWVSLRVIQEIFRDRRTLAFFFLAPIVVMTLIYYAVAEDEIVKVGVLSRGAARIFDYDLVSVLEADEDVEVVPLEIPDEETDPKTLEKLILKQLLEGKVDGVLYLDEKLLVDRFDMRRGTLHVYVEGSTPIITSAVFASIADAMDELAEALPVVIDASCSAECASSVNNKAMEMEKHYIYTNDDYRLVDYFLPVLPTFFVFFFTFIVSAITFQRERLRGTLERLLVAPISFFEIVAGYVGGFLIFVSLQSVIILGYILYLIKFDFSAYQVFSLGVVTLLTMLLALMTGLLVSFISANEFQALQFIPLIILPQIFLSDIIWDVERFPPFFRFISYFFPLTHSSAASREIMIRNLPLLETWPQLAVLTVFIVVVFFAMVAVANRKVKPF